MGKQQMHRDTVGTTDANRVIEFEEHGSRYEKWVIIIPSTLGGAADSSGI